MLALSIQSILKMIRSVSYNCVLFVACVFYSPNTFAYYLDLSNFLDFLILELYPSVSCLSVLLVLQDVTALICENILIRNDSKPSAEQIRYVERNTVNEVNLSCFVYFSILYLSALKCTFRNLTVL